MDDARARDLLSFARELERQDELLAAELSVLNDVQETVEAVRSAAPRIQEFQLRLPDERTRLARRVADSETAAAEARRALERSQSELAEAERRGSDEAVAAARGAVADAHADLDIAVSDLEEAHAARAALERDAAAHAAELPALADRAQRAALLLAGVPRATGSPATPAGDEPAALADWAARARAAAFVARSTLESQREAVVRQANEVAAGALGEPLSATTVALVRRRLEREIG